MGYFQPGYFPVGYFQPGYFSIDAGEDAAHPFKLWYPEFVTLDDALIDRHILRASLEVSESWWVQYYTAGLYALAAHFLTLDLIRRGDTTGPWANFASGKIASKSVGSVSVSYKTGLSSGFTEDWYQLTDYGQDYWRMKKFVSIGAVAVIG